MKRRASWGRNIGRSRELANQLHLMPFREIAVRLAAKEGKPPLTGAMIARICSNAEKKIARAISG